MAGTTDGIDYGPFRVSARTLRRVTHAAPFRPRYTVSQAAFDDLRAVERADSKLREFRVDDRLAHRMLREALSRNAFGTASIEGNPLTLEDVESLLVATPTPDRVVEPEEREILNYAAFARDLGAHALPRTPEDVARLHAVLFDGVLPESKRGAFKDRPNFVGRRETREVVFVATLPEHVHAELDSALDWLHAADEHPLVRVIVFFHEFQSIHPFADGNGRLGRALTTLAAWHNGYRGIRFAPLDYAFNADRDQYYAKLDEARANDWDLTPWVTYMARMMRESFAWAVHRFLFRYGLPDDLNERQVRVAEWVARLDADRPGRRFKFGDVHAGVPDVPRRTLQADLARLVSGGLLEKQGARKATTYRFTGGQ